MEEMDKTIMEVVRNYVKEYLERLMNTEKGCFPRETCCIEERILLEED